MKRVSFEDMPCSLARALEMIGEWWTLLIIREAFLGTRRFSDFQSRLGIARNVLTERLDRLVANGILRREPVAPGARRQHYRLTDKGRDLVTVVVALLQWGDRWIHGEDGAPVRLVERASGAEVAPVMLRATDGRPLTPRDIRIEPGPGADAATAERFGERIAESGGVRWRIRPHMTE